MGLLILSLLIAVGAVCILIYKQQKINVRKMGIQQQMLASIDMSLRELSRAQQQTYKRLDQLATDVLQREIYKSADERHQLAIQSARQGQTVIELMQRYGLSSDEATLIVSMHSASPDTRQPSVQNANLTDPTVAELI